MKKIAILSLLLLLFASCKTKQVIQHNTNDSVRVEFRTIEKQIVRIDTVTVQLPAIEKQVVKKDSSFLQTKYSTSKALILPSGLLFHELKNKPIAISGTVNTIDRIVYKDSIIYKSKIEVKEVPIKTPLSKLQRYLIVSGALVHLAGIAWLVLKLKKIFI